MLRSELLQKFYN